MAPRYSRGSKANDGCNEGIDFCYILGAYEMAAIENDINIRVSCGSKIQYH
jgi:hypothetical protein